MAKKNFTPGEKPTPGGVWYSTVQRQSGTQPSTQDVLNMTQRLLNQQTLVQFDDILKKTLSIGGVCDYMIGRRPKLENPDTLLKKEVCRVMLHLSSDTYLPTTQMQQLAGALLIENQSEFILGVIDEEQNFKEDWEVSRMGRQWKGWGGIEKETAKLWLDENKGVLAARFPYKAEVIDKIRERVPKGKKSWNPDDKVWEFSIETIDVIVEILSESFENVIDLTQAAAPSIQVQATDQLLSLLDDDDVQVIHRLLVKRHHPDHGGDSDLMAKINTVFSQRKKK